VLQKAAEGRRASEHMQKETQDRRAQLEAYESLAQELGESPETGALRELREETGLHGEIDTLLGVTTSSNRFYNTVLLIGYLVRQFTGEPFPGEDASEIEFFPLENMPEIAFESHSHFLRVYQDNHIHVKKGSLE